MMCWGGGRGATCWTAGEAEQERLALPTPLFFFVFTDLGSQGVLGCWKSSGVPDIAKGSALAQVLPYVVCVSACAWPCQLIVAASLEAESVFAERCLV